MGFPGDPETLPSEGNGVGAPGPGKAPSAPRMKKPQPPDRTEMDKQIEKLNAEIEKHAGRIKQIKEVLQARRDKSKGASSEDKAILRRLGDLKAQMDAAKKQKQQLREEIGRADQTRDALRTQVRALKERVKYTTVEEIDAQIQRLEQKLNHSTLSPKEEEWSVKQIKDLAQSRASVRNFRERLEKMQEDDRLREDLVRRVAGVDEKLDALKAELAKERARLGELHAARDDETTEDATLKDEKDECWQIMVALRTKRDEIRAEYKSKFDEFKKQENKFFEWQREDRKKKQEARKIEKEQRQAERAAIAEEYKMDIYEEKQLRCDQLLAYLGKFSAPSKEDTAKAATKNVTAPEPGMKLLTREQDDDLEGWFAGMGSKGKAKKQKGKKVMKEDRPTEEKKLMHTLDILQAFHHLQIAVPNTVSEVPTAIELVKAKKEMFREKKEKGIALTEPHSETGTRRQRTTEESSNGGKAGTGSNGEGKAGAGGEGLAQDKVNVGSLNDDDYPALVSKHQQPGAREECVAQADTEASIAEDNVETTVLVEDTPGHSEKIAEETETKDGFEEGSKIVEEASKQEAEDKTDEKGEQEERKDEGGLLHASWTFLH